jgi:predicted metal-dependent hydrolase
MTNVAYRIERSPERKKLTITVERDRAVVVRVPLSMSDSDIDRIVTAKGQWIREKLRHPQKYRTPAHPPGKEVVSGESAPYLGREYRIELAPTTSNEVEFDRMFIVPPARQVRRHDVLKNGM